MAKSRIFLKAVTAILAVCLSVGVTVGCNPFVQEEEKVDTSKVQLYVGTFNQGFGRAWIDEAAARFAEANKDVSFTPDTTGVQILVDNIAIGDTFIGQVSTSRDEIIFNESIDYYAWIKNDHVRDITDIVTGDMAAVGESGKTIEGKMSGTKDFFKYTDGHYYGIPFYEATFGIQYDIDLFEQNSLYMDASGNFTLDSQTAPNVSAGPDGDPATTIDNGLPATFTQFYALCKRIKDAGMLPVNWTPKYPVYISRLVESMAAYLDGYDEAMRKWTMKGNAAASSIVTGFDGDEPILNSEPIAISEKNGYLTTASKGNYYALKFVEGIIDGEYYNVNNDANQAYTHRSAQDDFVLNSNIRANSLGQDVAMLVDGTWFLNEALPTLNKVVNLDGGADKRRFGLMPLPHPDGWADIPFTYLDTNAGACMVTKKAPDSKMDLIKKFLQFLRTDAEMRKFTETTSTLLAYDGYLDNWDLSGSTITPYGKQLIEIKKAVGDKVVRPMSNTQLFADNMQRLYINPELYFSSQIGNSTLVAPISAMTGNSKHSAKSYFEGMRSFHSKTWWDSTFAAYIPNN